MEVVHASVEPLLPLGYDILQFLGACVFVTPICKKFNVSAILGFLLVGVCLRHWNTISDPKELSELAELGVLFLLFEMGLELSSNRLQKLSKYAFGLGVVQVLVTTIVFVLFTVPFGKGIGTLLLEHLAGADHAMARIDSWDEAVVVAVALSLSSSAFVLQILGEKGQLATRAGSATLGILLLQDLITIPFLVMLPLLEGRGSGFSEIVQQTPIALVEEFLPTALLTLMYLGGLVLFGRFGLRRVFEVVAGTGSKDAFVALCLLTVCGTAIATENLGFGQTLGAFLAGVLLAETSYRSQVEADLKPFKGLLLGLFFLCTGASVDVELLVERFPVVALLTAGLIAVKFAITATAARSFGLGKAESVKVGLTLSQGGEFAFVLLELAKQLEVLPAELNSLLIITVVMSMALTPFLAELGDHLERQELKNANLEACESLSYELLSSPGEQQRSSVVVLLGFNKASQMVTNMLSSPLVGKPIPWVAFEFDPKRVRLARGAGLPVYFGDGSRKEVLHAAGVEQPLAFVLTQKSHLQMKEAVQRLKAEYPDTLVYALCRDMRCAAEIKSYGAYVKVSSAQGGIALGDLLLRGIGPPDTDLTTLEREMMAAVKETVRGASLRRPDDDTDLELFIFDRAQAVTLVGEAHRQRVAARSAGADGRILDVDQGFLSGRNSDLSSSEALSEYSDDSESDVEWQVVLPDSGPEASSDSDVNGSQAAAEERVASAAMASTAAPSDLKSMLTAAKNSVKGWQEQLNVSSRHRAAQNVGTDDSDTDWASEDFVEWRAESENRKAWESLQLRKVPLRDRSPQNRDPTP